MGTWGLCFPALSPPQMRGEQSAGKGGRSDMHAGWYGILLVLGCGSSAWEHTLPGWGAQKAHTWFSTLVSRKKGLPAHFAPSPHCSWSQTGGGLWGKEKGTFKHGSA